MWIPAKAGRRGLRTGAASIFPVQQGAPERESHADPATGTPGFRRSAPARALGRTHRYPVNCSDHGAHHRAGGRGCMFTVQRRLCLDDVFCSAPWSPQTLCVAKRLSWEVAGVFEVARGRGRGWREESDIPIRYRFSIEYRRAQVPGLRPRPRIVVHPRSGPAVNGRAARRAGITTTFCCVTRGWMRQCFP